MTPGNDWLEQARQLVAGLGQTLAAGATAPAGAAQGAGDTHEHGGDCRWCPLCQAVGVLRGERPELTTALADALTAAAAALRTLAAEPPRTAAEPTTAGATPEEQPADGADRPVVQHIEIA